MEVRTRSSGWRRSGSSAAHEAPRTGRQSRAEQPEHRRLGDHRLFASDVHLAGEVHRRVAVQIGVDKAERGRGGRTAWPGGERRGLAGARRGASTRGERHVVGRPGGTPLVPSSAPATTSVQVWPNTEPGSSISHTRPADGAPIVVLNSLWKPVTSSSRAGAGANKPQDPSQTVAVRCRARGPASLRPGWSGRSRSRPTTRYRDRSGPGRTRQQAPSR